MSELKPCPFCGEDVIKEYDNGVTFLVCRGCIGTGIATGFPYRDTNVAVSQWNTRPIEDALTAEIVSLKAKVAELEADIKKIEERADYVYNQNSQMKEALRWLLHLLHGISKSGESDIPSQEWFDALELAEQALKGGE